MTAREHTFYVTHPDEGVVAIGPNDEIPDWAKDQVHPRHYGDGEQAPSGDSGEVFDPAAHNVAEVNAYLAEADEAERARVLAAEEAGQARVGVLNAQSA